VAPRPMTENQRVKAPRRVARNLAPVNGEQFQTPTLPAAARPVES